MTTKEAAETLGVSEQSVRLFIQSGQLGIYRQNHERKTYLVNESEVKKMKGADK